MENQEIPDEVEESIKLNLEASVEIMKLKPKPGTNGQIKCPKCGGTIDWVMHQNSHVWAKCQTDNCLGWIE